MSVLDFPDWSVDFNEVVRGALATIPEHIVGREGVPDLTHPMASYRYLEKRRETIIDSVRQRPLIRLFDHNMEYVGQIASERSVMVEEVMADSGSGNIVLRRDNWLSNFMLYDRRAEEDLHVVVDPIATAPDWRTRWGGKCINVNAKRGADGLHTVELEMLSNREHLKHILAGANPIFSPEVQIPKLWVLPWNCRTALSITMFINLARQFFPFLSIPTNIFNPGGWIGTGISGLDPRSWPIQVQFVNPIFDQSRTIIYTSRWTDMHTTSAAHLEDAGCMIRAYSWLESDKTGPHPELEVGLKDIPFIGNALDKIADTVGLPDSLDDLARPTRNCVVMAVEDKSGTTGPTGTLLDGPIKLIAQTLDDGITEILRPVDRDMDNSTDPFFRKLALVAPEPPWAVFRDGEYSGIVESQRSMHAATAKTIMVGSKSPGWVNQLQTFAIKWGLAQLSDLIYAAAPTGMAVDTISVSAPGSPGLEELYQGQLDDCCAATTFVDGPDGSHQIKKLAEHGGPFRVWSITPWGKRVVATAVFAFKKGRAEQFEYTLANGRSITVTGDHRFLTDTGYARAHSVMVGTRIAVTDGGYSPVVNIEFVGTDDYYDMHVPGWENYAAEGMWNHNTLLAWQRQTDPIRAIRMGDFGFLEHFETGTGSAYTVSAQQDIRSGHFKTRSYVSFKVTVRNGVPYLVGYDFALGDRLGFEMANIIHVDQCTAIRHFWDDENPITVGLSIGNDSEEEDPVARATRTLAAVWNTVGMFLGSGDLF